jgi:DNA polymerase-3 subunit delta
MGVVSFDALLRSVKKAAPHPAYYLFGDEDVLKDEAVQALCEAALDPAARDFNLDFRSAGDLEPEALYALVNTPPMLADRRVVVLRNLEGLRRKPKARAELLKYLRQPSPSAVVVMVQGAGEERDEEVAQLATAVDAARLPPERAVRWAAHHAGRHGVRLDPDAAAFLVQAVGDDLGVLGREIEKLAGVADSDTGVVGRDQVAALVGVRRGETLEDLVRAVMTHDPGRGGGLVGHVLQQPGMSGVRIVTALGTELIGTALARAELDGGVTGARLTSVLRDHIFRARPRVGRPYQQAAGDWATWAQRWDSGALSRALRLTLAADRALKSSTVTDDRGILLQLVLTLGQPPQEAT